MANIIQNGQHYRCGAYAGANLVGGVITSCLGPGQPCRGNCNVNCCSGSGVQITTSTGYEYVCAYNY